MVHSIEKYQNKNSFHMSATTVPVSQRFTAGILGMDSSSMQRTKTLMAAQTTCNNCYARLFEYKRQAMKCIMAEYQKISIGASAPPLESLPYIVYQHLKLNDSQLVGTVNGICTYCGIYIESIKENAINQTTNFAPFVTRNMMTQHNVDLQHNNDNFGVNRPAASYGETSDSINGKRIPGLNKTDKDDDQYLRNEPPARVCTFASSAQFFAVAAKTYNIPGKRKSSKRSEKNRREDTDFFTTNFSRLLRKDPPANPPGLFKYMGRRVDGKVSVMLRITPNTNLEQTDSFIEIDQRRKQISTLQPKNLDVIPVKLQTANATPKLYAFDAVFEQDLPQTRVSSSSVLDVLHAVINGGEGCLLVYGAANTGKTATMVGNHSSNKELGILPSSIAWLYSLLEDCKQRTGARISVRVSAVEVVGQQEILKDLLSEQASGGDSNDSHGASPGIYLREDPVGGTVQLDNVSEPQAVTADKAAFYLDAALAARTAEKNSNGQAQSSHMIFTIHVYQYRVEKNLRRGSGAALPYSGGRSRLHLIDLSHVNSNYDKQQHNGAPSHAALGQIIVAMLNGFKQVPYRDSKITRLLKDSIGNLTCRSTLIAHVSEDEKNYAKTCATLQLVSKINRSRRRRNKNCSSSSDNNSCDETGGRRRRPHPAMIQTYGIEDCASSDYNTSSAGEDSCDTVIYMGGNGHMSDRDLTDNERPPSPDTFKAIKMKLASSSEDEMPQLPLNIRERETKSKEIKPCEIVRMDHEPKKFEPSLHRNDNENAVRNVERKLSDCDNQETSKVNITSSKISSDVPTPFKTASNNNERAVNVVAPLIIKNTTTDSNRTTSPSTDDTKISLVDQLIENRNTDDVILIPDGDDKVESAEKIPSEKELRKREKRIAKLLKDSLSGDDLTPVQINNKKNIIKSSDGYMSDVCKSLSDTFDTSKKYDGYISAPENNFHKPVQIVRGTVRQQASFDETLPENSKDVIITKLLESLKQCNVVTSKDAQENTVNASISLLKSPDNLDSHTKVDDSSCSKKQEQLDYPNDTCSERPETNLDEPDTSDCIKNQTGSNDETDCLKIKNLDHVITVSTVPNFTVAKKPAFKEIASNANIPQSSLRTSNVRGNKGSMVSLSSDGLRTPQFERSYSKEDTCSLMSAYESDAYDSDTYSSYTASPAVLRHQGRPTRLRYRWSTVYEEDENKKDAMQDKNSVNNKSKKTRKVFVDSEPKPARVITSPKKSAKSTKSEKRLLSPKSEKKLLSPKADKKLLSPKNEKKLLSPKSDKKLLSPKAEKIFGSQGQNEDLVINKKENKKFNFLSPKSERKQPKVNSSSYKRMSGCSDASSGIGSTSSQSQTSSLHSGEEIRIDAHRIVKEPSKSKLWPFSRSKSRKSRGSCGYMSDGNLTDSSSVRSSRRYRFFSRSKSSLYNDGHSSGYDTSITEGGTTSCAEDLTDNESVRGKKKKRFLGFRRRSTNDLSSSRGRVKKPLWLDSRRCQSDDEGVQIKVYEIDGPRRMNHRQYRSEDMGSRIQPRRLEELKKHREHLKSELHSTLDMFPHVHSPAQYYKYDFFKTEPTKTSTPTLVHDGDGDDDQKTVEDLEKENGAISRKLKVLKNHIQIVTCFDANTEGRKVTQI